MNAEQIKDAREALDSMDDYARMETGINAIGPRNVLEAFIASAEATIDASDDLSAQMDAAEERASLYDDDLRDAIKTDVMNSFYAGVAWARANPLPAPVSLAERLGKQWEENRQFDRDAIKATLTKLESTFQAQQGCHFPLCESPEEQQTIAAQVHAELYTGAQDGPGTPSARLGGILSRLSEIFPDLHNQFAAAPPEIAYLERIAALQSQQDIAHCRDITVAYAIRDWYATQWPERDFCVEHTDLVKAIAALKAQQGSCDECGKKQADGWALYCVECGALAQQGCSFPLCESAEEQQRIAAQVQHLLYNAKIENVHLRVRAEKAEAALAAREGK